MHELAALFNVIGPANIATYVIAINFIAFAAFGIDKMLAEAGMRRIAESTLLLWAGLGGTPCAYLARHMFRHKTRKQPFSDYLHMIATTQAVVLVCLIGLYFFS